MAKKFLFSVANAYYYRSNSQDLIFSSKTLIDSSIDATISNEDIRAGQGNPLQFVYFHSAELNVNLTEAQFNLDMLAPSIGAYVQESDIIQTSESIVLNATGGGTVTGTPVNSKYVIQDVVQGTVELPDGTHETVTFTAGAFTTIGGAEGDNVCVTYNVLNGATRSIVVDANLVPAVGRLVLKAQLGSSTGSADQLASSVIGEIEIEIPALQLNPSGIGLSMSASGVSQTSLSGRALSYEVSNNGCTQAGVYATIKETIYNTSIYDNARALTFVNQAIALSVGQTTTPNLLVIPNSGSAFAPTPGTVVYTTSDAAIATVDASSGLITAIADGQAVITATIAREGKSSLVATATVVVS